MAITLPRIARLSSNLVQSNSHI